MTEFNKRMSQCKKCIKAYQASYRKNGPSNPEYNKPVTEMPKTNVFSINPETGQPYISIEVATKVIKYHVAHFGLNVLNSRLNTMEDIVQGALTKLCAYKYDPKLSAPKTFIILVCKSYLGRLAYYGRTYDKNLEVSDFLVEGIDGEKNLASESFGPVDNITPEEVLLAEEFLEEFYSNPTLTSKGKPRVVPVSHVNRGPKLKP